MRSWIDYSGEVVWDPSLSLAAQLVEAGQPFWLDIESPTDEVIDQLATLLGLHPLAVEDSKQFGQRAKLQVYGNGAMLVGFGLDEQLREPVEVHCYYTTGYLITLRRAPSPALDVLRQAGSVHPLPGSDPIRALHPVISSLYTQFSALALGLDERLDALEQRVLREADDEELAEITAIRRRAAVIRRIVTPGRDLAAPMPLILSLPGTTNETQLYAEDINDELQQVVTGLAAIEERCIALLALHASLASKHPGRLRLIPPRLLARLARSCRWAHPPCVGHVLEAAMVSRIKRSVPVTVNDVLDGHVQLDLDCLDRLYLHGYLGQLQVGGQVIQFLQHRGYPVPSPACLQQIGDAFRRKVASFADANHIPVVTLKAADRNIEVMGPYLERAAATGRSQVAAIGMAQEMQRVFISRQRPTDPGKCPQFSFDKKDRRVTVYYFYLWDAGFGPAFIKICTYCPWPVKIWVNGHEWAKQQARKIGLGFTELSNGFAACEDPALLQRICDALQPGTINVFFQRWLSRLPVPLGAADQQAGYWWELSMAQVEVSRTLVFTQPRHARTFFEALVTDNLDLGRPDSIEIIFDRRIVTGQQRATQGTFKTKVITRGTEVTINAFYRHSRIKQYLKDGRALRIETVINSPTDLRIGRRLACLNELQDTARAINARLLDTERAGQGCVLANPVFERIAHPSLTADGRRATAMRFGDSRVQALAGALCHTTGAVTGITNRSLRALMTGLLGTPYGMTQASYDLARLRRNGLITRRPHANTYDLTPDGLKFAIFYTKVHDRVLAPLFAAGQPQAPPQLRAALRDIEQLIDNRLAEARLPKAA